MELTSLDQLSELNPTPDDRRWLDGRVLAGWLYARFSKAELRARLGKLQARAVERWHVGATTAKLETADQVLTQLDCHLHQLPYAVWTRGPRRAASEAPREKVAA